MLANPFSQKTVFYVKTSKGIFGPYPSRYFAEHMVVLNQIPKNENENVEIIEKFENGTQLLLD